LTIRNDSTSITKHGIQPTSETPQGQQAIRDSTHTVNGFTKLLHKYIRNFKKVLGMTDTNGKINSKILMQLAGEILLTLFGFILKLSGLHLYKYSIKSNLNESGHDSFNWINVVQNIVQWQAPMTMVPNFWVP
jgi:hypothetical protein